LLSHQAVHDQWRFDFNHSYTPKDIANMGKKFEDHSEKGRVVEGGFGHWAVLVGKRSSGNLG
jgi:hypothetical protein